MTATSYIAVRCRRLAGVKCRAMALVLRRGTSSGRTMTYTRLVATPTELVTNVRNQWDTSLLLAYNSCEGSQSELVVTYWPTVKNGVRRDEDCRRDCCWAQQDGIEIRLSVPLADQRQLILLLSLGPAGDFVEVQMKHKDAVKPELHREITTTDMLMFAGFLDTTR